MRGALDFRREFRVVERLDGVGLCRIEHPDQARALARQRHQRERPARRVEFGRGVVVRPRVREADRERDLRIVAFVDRDAGGGAAERSAPVGGDNQRRAQVCRRS